MLPQIREMLVIFYNCKEIYVVKSLKGRYKIRVVLFELLCHKVIIIRIRIRRRTK